MLIAHKVIDALLRQDKGISLVELPGITPERCAKTAAALRQAQKFDFGPLPLETEEVGTGIPLLGLCPDTVAYKLPALTEDELDFWQRGLIPLPYATCWYEFTIGRFRSGLLILEQDPKWLVQRVDFVEGRVMYDGVVVILDRIRSHLSEYKLAVELTGNPQVVAAMGTNEQLLRDNLGVNGPLAIYLTLMLNSRTTEIRTAERPSDALNQARRKRGREPLVEHRIVRIVPERFQYEYDPVTGRPRRSPRLHWRRSHARHYDRRVPSAVWSEALEHNGRKG